MAGDGPGLPEPGKGAFAALWREWKPRACAYLRAFGGLDDEERDGLATEAIMRAEAARGSYDPERPFAPWFFSILRRLALDALARPRERPEPPEYFSAEASPREEAEAEILRGEEEAFTRRFVAGLDERDRELLSLVYGQDLGLGEAAEIIGMRGGTAKWRMHEIRKALKAAWERAYA